MSVFEAVGLGPADESAYRVLLARDHLSAAELATELGCSRERVRRTLASMQAKGLVSVLPSRPPRYVAVPPEIGLDLLILRREEALKEARRSASELAEWTRQATRAKQPLELIEIVTGRDAITQRLESMQRRAREIKGFDAPPYSRGHVTAGVEFECLRNGVVYKGLYAQSAITTPGKLADIERCVAAGEEARVLPHVPTKLTIADDREAIMPLDPNPRHVPGAWVVVHESALLVGLVALFDDLWQRAIPLKLAVSDARAGRQSDTAPGPSEVERRLLACLAAGLTDDALARQLGVSRRTAQRQLQSLMMALGAETRFQAGALAARRGWL